MASRVKEDQKNERIIRNLLKLPDNRRCINCNSLGPQYVCTNFSTFVCTTCSGIHREFTHRVKSVSMAKFTSQEVSALQGGGNASAKEIYLKELDPQRNSLPDTSNVERLRTFIKHVYVDRRYTGERKVESSQGGSRSPPYDRERPSPGGRSDDRNPRNSYNERRSPGFDQGSPPYADTRSPNRTGVVNDWRREDRFSNGRRSDDDNLSDGSSKFEGRSPEHQKDLHMSSPPVVRPVREILGDNVVPLRIIGPPKANGSRPTGGSFGGQRTLSSSSLASSNGNPAEIKRENSLIDFDAFSEPPPAAPAAPAAAATAETQQPTVVQTVTQPVASPGDNWACFDSSPPVKTSQAPAPANKNSLESLFGDLSVSAPVPAQPTVNVITHDLPFGNVSSVSQSPFGDELSLFGDDAPAPVSANNTATFPPVGAAPVTSAAGQIPSLHYGVGVSAVSTPSNFSASSVGVPTGAPGQATAFPTNNVNAFSQVAAGGNQPNTVPFQPFAQAVGGSSSNQPWGGLPVAGNTQGVSMPAGQTSQLLPTPGAQGTVGVNTSSVDAKPSGRKELPSDLFSFTYPSPGLAPGWQAGPHPGYGFNMQYNNVMPMPTYPMPVQSAMQSTNPFDNEASSGPAPTFPSMGPVHGAMPNVAAPGGLLHTSNHGAPSPWMPPQQAPSFASAIPNNFSGGFVGQQVPSNLPTRQPGVVGFGNDGSAFGPGPLGPNQHLGGMHPAAPNANAFPSVGGNPFG